MDYWLGLDCGGTFIKAGLYDRQGTELGIARRNLEIVSPQPGWAERDMPALWHTAAEVIRELLTRNKIAVGDIQAVGISAQGKGAFLLDQQGQPLGNAMLSSDQRALALVQEWQKQGVPQTLYPQTRQTLWTGHPVSLLRWVRQHQPERYRQIGSVLMAHDYLRYCLTGELACEETNISESNLYQMAEGRYDPALAQLLGIGDIMPTLPPIVGSAEIAGRINAAAAKATGLLPGTPVVGGLFDVVSTALCAGLHDETRLNAVMGTWSVYQRHYRQNHRRFRPPVCLWSPRRSRQIHCARSQPNLCRQPGVVLPTMGAAGLRPAQRLGGNAAEGRQQPAVCSLPVRLQRRTGPERQLPWHAGLPPARAFGTGDL
ncbi:L-xylulose/3-keto-L-gulonate kinase [Serratia quinivorans]|uniref:L-xylulose/3-keto-L-gulonate kinase n=1 Tax=Serratia quinivorans TaxID=137545 RepID=A0A380A3G5_9GAMM|nr:L-xylulose/3-keto-L-gulonate kinase [Serratia quinivorans]